MCLRLATLLGTVKQCLGLLMCESSTVFTRLKDIVIPTKTKLTHDLMRAYGEAHRFIYCEIKQCPLAFLHA